MSDANPIEISQWISPKQAVELLAATLTDEGAKAALFYRASRGALKARAIQQLHHGRNQTLKFENEAVDPQFFRATSPEDSSENAWRIGDFLRSVGTHTDHGFSHVTWEVIGLQFDRAGVATLLEASRPLDEEESSLSLATDLGAPSPTIAKGRPIKQHLAAAALVGFKLGRKPLAERTKPTKAMIMDEMKKAYAAIGDTDGVVPPDASAVLRGILLGEELYLEGD